MGQDFGDDIGGLLVRSSQSFATMAIRFQFQGQQRLQCEDWSFKKLLGMGHPADEAKATAKELASRETTCVPFGTATDAAYFSQICCRDGVFAIPFEDGSGNGYVQFAASDLEQAKRCLPRFSETMTRLQTERVAQSLNGEPVNADKLKSLREIDDLPDLPDDGRAAERVETPRHTQDIADKVRDARARCTDLQDFRTLLAAQGVGITTNAAGEHLFYEARTGEGGTLLPFEHRKDWSVGADTLHAKYGVDARLDDFPRERPTVSDGSLDQRGETPDPRQGIASHDGMDTDSRTLRLEREQNGTDVPPSKAREDNARGYSLASEAKDMRAASKQLAQENGVREHVADISDKLNPVR